MGKPEKHDWGEAGSARDKTERENSGHHETPNPISEGFLEEVTFRLRSEVGAGQDMNRRKGASERGKRICKGPEGWRSGKEKD